jgi:hypothetical protein
MLTNRIQDFWSQIETEAAAEFVAPAAFVPCPCPIMQSMSQVQQAHMEKLYRLAYEQAQAQVDLDRRARAFDFSAN